MDSHDDWCERIDVDIGVGVQSSPCGCRDRQQTTETERLRAEVAELKKEVYQRRCELNSFRPARDDETYDENASCLRCGLSWDGEKDSDDKHCCPPGFWNEYEKEIADLKRQLAEANRWLSSREDELKLAQDALAKVYTELALASEEYLTLRQRIKA